MVESTTVEAVPATGVEVPVPKFNSAPFVAVATNAPAGSAVPSASTALKFTYHCPFVTTDELASSAAASIETVAKVQVLSPELHAEPALAATTVTSTVPIKLPRVSPPAATTVAVVAVLLYQEIEKVPTPEGVHAADTVVVEVPNTIVLKLEPYVALVEFVERWAPNVPPDATIADEVAEVIPP